MSQRDEVRSKGIANQRIAALVLLTSLGLFGFYTFWAIVLPFLPDDSLLHPYFPARKWAILIPSLILVLGLSTVGIYIGVVMRQDLLHDASTTQKLESK
ncbi:hypothetical protein BCV70DRAFT_238578 [Testicularia cyperi]|uniref:Dolichol phosphate-mannose biosynthesis regulatory protein n=1 Tax=Testicularia cyperi TaxID=1882483 RepID=A0A317XM91_9BASI|nr:hypothetical protein BCV70DRAFT_238578 [Testicularia cyperi]